MKLFFKPVLENAQRTGWNILHELHAYRVSRSQIHIVFNGNLKHFNASIFMRKWRSDRLGYPIEASVRTVYTTSATQTILLMQLYLNLKQIGWGIRQNNSISIFVWITLSTSSDFFFSKAATNQRGRTNVWLFLRKKDSLQWD